MEPSNPGNLSADRVSVDWNTPDELARVEQSVLSLQLPEYDGGATEWTEAVDDVWEYAGAVADSNQHNIAFFSK